MENHPASAASGIFNSEIVVTEESRVQLLEMAKWTKFLAIVNFIAIGLMVIVGGIAALAFSSLAGGQLGPLAGISGIGIFLLYLLLAALIIYPFYQMLRYSNGMRAALGSNNELQFSTALRSLKRMFKYWGILTLIFLGLYALVFVGSGVLTAFR